MNYVELFSGIGGGIVAHSILQRHECIGASEKESYPLAVLAERMAGHQLNQFPLLPPVEQVDGRMFRGVGMIAGGFPCQGLSLAGTKKWLDDPRSALVWHMLRICEEARPRYIFAENSPNLRTKGLHLIIPELQRMGYGTIAWAKIGADDCGAPHVRKRIWLMAKRGGKLGMAHLPAPKKISAWGIVSGSTYEPLTFADLGLNAPRRGFILPTLLCSDARKSGNRKGDSLWSLSDRLGLTRKCERLVIPPTLAATDYKAPYSPAGLEKQMTKRSKPLRDMLPYYLGGWSINPSWAEWFMGWPVGWTDLSPKLSGLADYRRKVMHDAWWTSAMEKSAGPATFPEGRRRPHQVDRIKALGNGQVPVVAVAASQILKEWCDG